MGLRQFLKRADETITEATEATRESLGWSVVASAIAIVISLAALVVAVVRR